MSENPGDIGSAAGGARDEAGGEYRRALAALFVAHALNGGEFVGLPFRAKDAQVETVALETDEAVDDILVGFSSGRLFVQAKRTLRFGRPLDEVVRQWVKAVRDQSFEPAQDWIAAGGGHVSRPLQIAAAALSGRRDDPGANWTAAERTEVAKLRAVVCKEGATEPEAALILSRCVFIERKVEEEDEPGALYGRALLDGHVVRVGEGGRAWRELISAAGRAARRQVGSTAGGWLAELRARGLPLITVEQWGSQTVVHKRNKCNQDTTVTYKLRQPRRLLLWLIGVGRALECGLSSVKAAADIAAVMREDLRDAVAGEFECAQGKARIDFPGRRTERADAVVAVQRLSAEESVVVAYRGPFAVVAA